MKTTNLYLRYVYRLEGADDLPANLALEPYLDRLAGDEPKAEGSKAQAFNIIEQAQKEARSAGWAGDIWTGEGVGSGPFVSLTPGKLTGGGTGILALYWSVKDEHVTYVVSSMLLPYLGNPFRTEGFELRTPGFEFDMSDWAIEKTTAQLQDLLYIKAELARTQGLTEDFKQEMMSHLGHLAWNGTKMLAFSSGADWGTDDAKMVLEDEEGLDMLLVKYGLRDETTSQEDARLLREYLADIRSLLDGPRVPNLDEVHELLREEYSDDELIEQLRDWEDDVQMGVMTWEEFCNKAKEAIDRRQDV